ncbi:SDR family oxidoreductase [Corynebacterium amycolatum]|uniref:SDR family oxidoreductase n=1 Tax=Corynebacterium amycolatum TaxID=43765 RepID=A0AAW9SWP3_CORAY|nr:MULTISPECIES: SDR family oxidoreductase [Corynebacterium]ASE57061.1 SDR family NAD(P)-dependent oxidoreductase [Corynebacterium jeikeium]MBC6829295.1 NAD(P)-dependent oxidoreductase [Corynebacterium sp. LK32]MDK7237815.1 SDR family oxidoreductase [Corynebacterium amycolatum]MDK7247771.1 SDR family oxidoreductase [Corynebacterium amycolatum]MDK8727223.1 SDR family oxidoreductase [Corynebacterium amycolatum]
MTSETSTNGRKVAVVTGASSGIGAATAKQFAAEGFRVVLGARREDKLEAVAEEIRAAGGEATVYKVDVTSDDDVAALAKAEPRVDVLVNNAGGAWGMESVEGAVEEKWRWMYEVNVLGTLRVTRALLPALKTTSGIVLTVGSIAGRQVYTGGAGYNAAKHAERALVEVLRQEVAVDGVRVTEIDPGRVHTDFSLVRFDGDETKAAAVYDGVESLTADDVADIIVFAATRPNRVNIDFLQVTPIDQVGGAKPKK